MGYFRFRRSIKIAPGVRWNIGKKGSSISVGGRGFTHTVGPSGSRTTVGIPGTGISYTQVHSGSKSSAVPLPALPTTPNPLVTRSTKSKLFYVFGMILLVIWLLGKISEQNTVSTNHAASALSSPSVSFSPSTGSSITKANESLTSKNVSATTPRAFYTPYSRTPITSYPTFSATPKYSPTAFSTPAGSPYVTQTPQPLDFAALPQQTPVPTPSVPTYGVTNIRTGDYLNIREGPASTSRIVARIPPSVSRGIMLGPNRRRNAETIWQEVSIGQYRGWVNADYLVPESQ